MYEERYRSASDL